MIRSKFFYLLLLAVFAICQANIATAQDYPKAELFGGYSYFRFQPTSQFAGGLNFNGGSGSIAVNPNRWLGIVGDFGIYHSSPGDLTDNIVSYLFGPKITYRGKRVTPYFHALFGGARLSSTTRGATSANTSNAFAWAIGGGMDASLTPHIAVRVAQAEYLRSNLQDDFDNRQNNVRFSAGIVFRWGESSK